MSDLSKLRKLAEAAKPTGHDGFCHCAECWQMDYASTELATAARSSLPALLDLVAASDKMREGSTTQTRRNYDTARAALAQALEVTDG